MARLLGQSRGLSSQWNVRLKDASHATAWLVLHLYMPNCQTAKVQTDISALRSRDSPSLHECQADRL